jgi:hypothetical protein
MNKYFKVDNVIIYPKSITMGELYGEENQNNDWFDGIASHFMRLGT